MVRPKKPEPGPLGIEPMPKTTLFAWLRSRFFAGVVIAAPIAISIGIVYWLITVLDARIKPLLPPLLKPETYTNIAIPGFGVFVAIIGLTILGAIATNLIGRSVVAAADRLLSRIPVVNTIYSPFKQLFDILGQNEQSSFKEVVLVQYPKEGTWCIGFLASRARGEVGAKLGTEFIGVFVPTTPNPTSGFILFVHEDEVVHLDMTIEEGAKMIISAGLVAPDYPANRVPAQVTNEADAQVDPKAAAGD